MYSNTRKVSPRLSGFPAMLLASLICIAMPPTTLAQLPGITDAERPEPVMLTNADIERFIGALTDLKQLGVQPAQDSDSDPSGMAAMTNALQTNADAISTLDKHGFDAVSFQRVGYSVMMAYAAGEMENASVEIAAARQQLEAMKSQMPPEQYAMLEQQILGALSMFTDQPPANVELVKPYKARIDAAVR